MALILRRPAHGTGACTAHFARDGLGMPPSCARWISRPARGNRRRASCASPQARYRPSSSTPFRPIRALRDCPLRGRGLSRAERAAQGCPLLARVHTAASSHAAMPADQHRAPAINDPAMTELAGPRLAAGRRQPAPECGEGAAET